MDVVRGFDMVPVAGGSAFIELPEGLLVGQGWTELMEPLKLTSGIKLLFTSLFFHLFLLFPSHSPFYLYICFMVLQLLLANFFLLS